MQKNIIILLFTICLCHAVSASAQEEHTQGIKAEYGAELTSEVQVGKDGKCNMTGLLRLHADVSLNESLSLEFASLSTRMTDTDGVSGDIQAFSNIDAGNINFTLAVCGLGWQIDNHHSLFLGIRNMNEDYFASPVTSFFTNSSCGIHPTLSFNYSIANYPLASVGIHYRYQTDVDGSANSNPGSMAIQASLYNGMGYHRFSGRENIFRLCPSSDGLFALTQVEYSLKGSSYFIGACGHYGTQDDVRRYGTTLWTYAEQSLCPSFSLIAAYSHAFADASQCSDFMGLGGKYAKGNIELGLFSDYALFDTCREWATELSCKLQLSPAIYLKPSLHAIVTKSLNDNTSTFYPAAALRLGIEI